MTIIAVWHMALATGCAGAVGCAATWLVVALTRRFGLFDQPNERSAHTAPTPTAGGLGVVAGFWAGVAVCCYLPSTVIPTGLNSNGLPIGIQIIGRQFGDLETIGLAKLLEDAGYAFTPPPGYDLRPLLLYCSRYLSAPSCARPPPGSHWHHMRRTRGSAGPFS